MDVDVTVRVDRAAMKAARMSPSVSTTWSSENGKPFTRQYDQ